VRFYVPEWEDHVDAEYDFKTDEHSAIRRSDRNLAYIWDIFDRDPAETPVDGILISREQIEESPERARRLKEYGVYDAPDDGTTLAVPEWLPTISDCGAWGYKSLPFPPYGNAEMLDFYEQLEVDVGVTIDHLVLGSGHAARLYIDQNAMGDGLDSDDLPEAITENVDVMVDEWPEQWPEYVDEYEPSLTQVGPARKPLRERFDSLRGLDPDDSSKDVEKRVKDHLRSISDDPRIVYRDDDMEFRFDLTLHNLREMKELYEAGEYSFRLMAAIQGWDSASYAKAARASLAAEYDYVGIGGAAGSNEEDVKRYVSAVGEVIKDYERAHTTRVDSHLFGFAKTGAFDTVGRSGISSFDSASMLRSAWTGGKNYHLDTANNDRRYDALRVRYPNHSGDLADAIDTALWSQEVLAALRAYDQNESIAERIRERHDTAAEALAHLEPHLREQRWAEHYDQWRIRDMTEVIQAHFEYSGELKACFSDRFRKRIIKLLRQDDPDDPITFDEYTALIDTARERLSKFPQTLESIEGHLDSGVAESSLSVVWTVVETYASWIDDEDKLDTYRALLSDRPWDECGCPICSSLGINVAIFRGNNRNRRRGFHNTKRFYDQFEQELPKLLIATKGGASLSADETVADFLRDNRSEFWKQVHDLPVVEIGAVTAEGISEWWQEPPSRISFVPRDIADNLSEVCMQYQEIYIDAQRWNVSPELRSAIEATECDVYLFDDPRQLRRAVLNRLDYDERTIPPHPEREEADQIGITDF